MNLPVAGLGASQGAGGFVDGRNWARVLLPAVVLCAGLGCGGGGAFAPLPMPTPRPTPIPSPKVVVISIDGLRPDAIGPAATQAEAPNITALARRGVYTWKAQTINPSITLPAHASMLSGVMPSVHGIMWDDYQPEKGCIGVPTVFSIAKAAGLRTVMVVGKEKFRSLNVPGTVDAFVFATRGDADVANEAVVQVQAGFDLMFVHLPDTDLCGHANGWLSATCALKVAAADQAVGRIVAALPPEATVILTADHGGHLATHGTTMTEDMTIPWIVAGPRVTRPGRELLRTVRTPDTAATALFILGLSLPTTATGTMVGEAFSQD
jgi:predicted AlkP superfamily pyrophosphatase or phosphodiesterase